MKLRMLSAAPDGLASVKIGDPLRCRYQGMKDDEVILERCSRISVEEMHASQLEGVILQWNLTKKAGDPLTPTSSLGKPAAPGQQAFTGVWEGTYSEAGKRGSFPLRIDTASAVEMDDGVKMNVVEVHIEDGNATVHAIWPNDPLERELFFTGTLRGDVWEGTMVGMGEARVNYRGLFTLRKTAR